MKVVALLAGVKVFKEKGRSGGGRTPECMGD